VYLPGGSVQIEAGRLSDDPSRSRNQYTAPNGGLMT